MFRGGRRWYAFLTKSLKIPARVIDVNDKDVLWKSYEENAFRTDLMPDEEAEHILRLIDAELKGTKEYEACNNDAKKVLAIVYKAHKGEMPKKKKVYHVVDFLKDKLDALFAALPRTRNLSLDTFYVKKLRVLKMPERTREKLRRKEVRGSASAEEAIASIKDRPDA